MSVFRTSSGRVRGRRSAPGVAAVLGIPYAAPPFGVNRFREPQPAAAWSGIRECTAFGPVAPQSAELPGAPSWSPGDEDILTLNVWAPESTGRGPLPVLVWIHGGAYTFGSSAQPDFDGTAPARAGLVVVTLNYRLGFEGFGHVPASGGGTPCPDNRGLLDQVAALRWVRENIAAFGGDPDRVTVAGQSSGATSAVCLMAMAQARGLFRRVIAHSPVHSCHSPELAELTTRKAAAAAGVPPTSEGLASTSPEALVAASDQVSDSYRRDPASGHRHHDPVLYGPVTGTGTLPAGPPAALASGAAREVDLLVCHTTEEHWLLDAVGGCAKVTTESQLSAFAADFGLPGPLVAGYRALMPGAPVREIHLSLYGDMLFGAYSHRLAESHARAGGQAHLSRFDRRRGGPGGSARIRAWHSADVPFAFGSLGNPAVEFLIGGPPGPADHELSHRMTRAWARFAATGDPGWRPLGGSPAAVHTWRTRHDDQGPVRDEALALWRGAEFPPLRP